ncbi:MAG: hypothetical protein ACPGVV_01500 [Croceimicrobium sp.]
MDSYKKRRIQFKEVVFLKDWKIKVYCISKEDQFQHPDYYKQAIAKIPSWLEMKNSFNSRDDKIGFLILHAGNEGIFAIINWWIDRHMMNSHIFLSTYKKLDQFQKISGDGLAPCIWELEVINHERVSWTKHVLQAMPEPNFQAYADDIINKVV